MPYIDMKKVVIFIRLKSIFTDVLKKNKMLDKVLFWSLLNVDLGSYS